MGLIIGRRAAANYSRRREIAFIFIFSGARRLRINTNGVLSAFASLPRLDTTNKR